MKNTSKIIRKADITKNFSIIPNHIAQSKDLSPNAKSLIIHILSMPDNWYYIKTQFWRETNLGRDAFMSAWKELQELGYIQVERIFEGNLIRGYNYIISDSPIFGFTENQLNRNSVKPKISKQLNTKETNNINTNNIDTKRTITISNGSYSSNSNNSNTVIADDDIIFLNEEKMLKESSLWDDSQPNPSTLEDLKSLIQNKFNNL